MAFCVWGGRDPTASVKAEKNNKKKTVNVVLFDFVEPCCRARPYADGVELLPEGELRLLVGGEHSVVPRAVWGQRCGHGEHAALGVGRAQQGARKVASSWWEKNKYSKSKRE